MQPEQSSLSSALVEERPSDVTYQSVAHLLAMAHRYQRESKVCQAMDTYWMLLEDHAGTAQSHEAEESLLKLAETYERDDAPHSARYLRAANRFDGVNGPLRNRRTVAESTFPGVMTS